MSSAVWLKIGGIQMKDPGAYVALGVRQPNKELKYWLLLDK
jgi:hypothetical protein